MVLQVNDVSSSALFFAALMTELAVITSVDVGQKQVKPTESCSGQMTRNCQKSSKIG